MGLSSCTRCALSLGPLTDPAKGLRCAHLAQCNYETLRDHIRRVKTCPIAGCGLLLQRSRDLERDDALTAQLRQMPPGTTRVHVRGAEVRAVVQAATAQPARCNRGRNQRRGGADLVVLG